MKYKELSNGVKIPVIGLGTWGFGGYFESDTSHEKKDIKIIQDAIKLGLNHIDTAEIYGDGQAEKEIGIAIKIFDRKKLFITTKVWKSNLHYNDVIASLGKSLKRLRTSYVDLYLIHWPNPSIPIKETMEAMKYLADKSKIKSIGVSNFSIQEIKEAQKYLKGYRIVANQIEYNILKREAEKELIPFCTKKNITVIAYHPLAKGKLANYPDSVLDYLSKKYGKTKAQIAIKWIISKKNMVTIPKSFKIEHIKQFLDTLDWELKKEDNKKIDRLLV